MSMRDHWSVELTIKEQDRLTVADARLTMDEGVYVFGHGSARRKPGDPEVTEIGEQIAAARALSDLAHMLLSAAAGGLEEITHQRADLQL
jgi:Rv2632c-like